VRRSSFLEADGAAARRARRQGKERRGAMRAVVVADGDPASSDAGIAAGADLVIAADGGAGWLERIGHRPDCLIGDLDSVDPAVVDRLAAAGTEVVRHPVDKDASDTELAIEEALQRGADEVVVLGALGGSRLDHELANLLLLADPDLASAPVRIVQGPTSVHVLRGPGGLPLQGGPGATVTLLPIGGDATGVTTTGLRYPLRGETLRMGRSRGLSNEVERSGARVDVSAGALLVVETDPNDDMTGGAR
jgi:thiamine pyrophosphokinase